MTPPRLPGRSNMLDCSAEPWRPPAFQVPTGAVSRFIAAVRRCLDLQAASIWNDALILLKSCEGTVLDVGCGAQPYRQLLPASVRYVGLDTSDSEAHFGYRIPDTIYYSGDAWPVETRSANVVFSTETLEHVEHPDRFLKEAARCLKPGGCLILTVPFAARWHYVPHDYWRFTPSGFRSLLEVAGFRQIVVYARGNAVTVAAYKCMALVLPLLAGQSRSPAGKWAGRVVGVLLSPLLAGLAAIAQLSLLFPGGLDCLGYTVVATAAGRDEPR